MTNEQMFIAGVVGLMSLFLLVLGAVTFYARDR